MTNQDQNQVIKKRTRMVIPLISIFIILRASAGYGDIQGTVALVACLICSFLVFVSKKNLKQIRINRTTIIVILFIVASSALTFLINSEPLKDAAIFYIYLFCAALVFISCEREKFFSVFDDVILFIAVCSLIVYIISFFAPDFLSKFGIVHANTNQRLVNDYIIAIYMPNSLRNLGVFWEPGAYQLFLNISLIHVIFEDNRKYRLFRIIVLSLSVISTLSTTGYIALAMIFLAYAIEKKEIRTYLLIVLICIAVYYFFNYMGSYYWSNLWRKFDSLDSVTTTGGVRTAAFFYSINSFFEHPIFGNGIRSLRDGTIDYGFRALTCTPANWFGYFGLGLGVLCNVSFGALFYESQKSVISKLIVAASLIVMVSSEEVAFSPIILILILFSIDTIVKRNTRSKRHLIRESVLE